MYHRSLAAVFLLFAAVLCAGRAQAQTNRDDVRTQLASVLETGGTRSDVNASFRQSTKNPYNYVATMTGLKSAESLEVVVSVTKSDTIGFRIYPHYKGGYINVGRARMQTALMRKLLYFSDQNFLFWGADDVGDVFCG